MSGRGPLRHAAFRWLLAARTTSIVGNAVAPIALAFAVLDLTGSAADLGLVVAARSIANVAVLLFGGVLADRLPRNLLLVGTSVAAALTQGGVAALVVTGSATVPALIVLSILNGAVAGVSLPASAALVPDTVPPDQLRSANALLRLGLNGGTILGASAGGILIASVGPGWGLAVDAAAFAAAAAFFSRLRLPERAAAPRTSMIADLREGWREFTSRSWVWIVVLQFAVLNAAFTGAVAVLGPVVADETIGRSAWGFVIGAQTLGLALGAVVALRWRPRRALGIGVAAMAFAAVPVATLAAAPVVPVLLVGFALGGFAIELFAIAWDQSLQSHIPRDALSRVYSYDMVGSFIAVPLGEAVVGPAAHAVGTTPVLWTCAALVVAATLVAASTRSVWRVVAPESGPAETASA
ncbi:MFS transporter [Microbacterium proteolyticum]|mgnify:CR=1 FL=1|uniref:MFS transporter n=1 Tax=Microbacterium proteolyticum TaxID=1572644 RepID=UPI002416C95B|nr:MFS transporter [Microbacterium proteolyticum]